MKKLAALMAAIAGGLLFWRRKDLKGHAEQVTTVARSASEAARRRLESRMTQKRVKFAEIGYLVYQAHAHPDSGDHRREIDELLSDLDALNAVAGEDDAIIDLTGADRAARPVGQDATT